MGRYLIMILSITLYQCARGAFHPSFSRRISGRTSARFLSSQEANHSDDQFAEYRNKNNIRDQVFSAISGDGGIKVTVCTIRNIMNDMSLQHSLSETTTDALGRTVACALLMANGVQDEQVVQITINTDGPIRGIVAIASGKGEVRGYVGTPGLTSMPLPEAVGKGAVQVVKNHPDWPRPYNGITAVRHGDIDRDVGLYLAESEQRSCALAAATTMNGFLCTAAGGYLIEQLPEVDQETISMVEKNIATLVEMDGGKNLPSNLLLNGVTPLEIADIILKDCDMKPLQQITPTLKCHCSENRLFRSIRLLPQSEVDEILETEEQIEARCQFCGKVYRMTANDVRQRLALAQGDPSRDDLV